MSAKSTSRSPVDGSILWQGEASSVDQVDRVMERASAALDTWRQTDIDQRVECARRYAEELTAARGEIASLISREVGKLRWDAEGEVNASIAKVELSIQAQQQRCSLQQLESKSGPQRVIRYRPIGVALVLGPFNFPLHLPGGQIIPSLLAGNTVVFKPSDQATAVGQWMMEAWERAGLPEHVIQMIPGGIETASAAIDSPQVGGVFLTGSRAAGRAIHRQLAGRPDVLLALELGGNNPVVIGADVPAATVASIVSFSSFVSSGQRCTCARRAIFIEGDSTRDQIDALVDRVRRLQLGMPGGEETLHVGPLISTTAAESLNETYDRLLQLGCKPVLPFQVDTNAANLVHPAIVDASGLDDAAREALGQMEWFGPLLVIQRADSFESALRSATTTCYGLAASLLGGSAEMFARFVDGVGAGVVNWNGPTTGAAGTMPFGGLGDSGNHRPAGFFAIDFCCDPIASLENPLPPESDPWTIAS